MSSNSDRIIQQLRHDFKELIEYVTGEGAQSRTAYEVELYVFRRLLALGAQLLRLFFVHRASVRPSEPVYASDGARLSYHGQRRTSYYSVFGKVQFERHYFYAPGHGGVCPLDAELSLPPRCYSDLLRDWAEYCVTDESYDEAIKLLERILGLSISKLALETGAQEEAEDVLAFYEQKAAPPVESEGPILVVQADRLSKGQKRTKKKEAVTTGIYTIQRYRRTPQEVVEALLRAGESDDSDKQASTTPSHLSAVAQAERPAPANKEVWATLDGKDVAFDRLARRVAQRDHAGQRVALTDGDDLTKAGWRQAARL